ncbi:unnamed protein product [Blepharisma stoltei]|uniref:PX domain-containing protein n=1 Tax=Blepharisma stoltei TaxID=1481888 RepID=A0AAU9IQ61_9CILI|nr:unnamed protein product [Blepharisma stoltei]
MAYLASASDLSTIYEVNETYASMASARPLPDSFIEKSIEIIISKAVIIEENAFTRYALYTITGRDSSGPFEASRRYSDFLALRNQLLYRWPGCFVPPIPPKKILGNLTSNFIESRKSLLQRFLQRISQITFLYTSEEFQMFIRGTSDFEVIIKNLKVATRDIMIVFHSLFCEFVDAEITDEIRVKLVEYDNFLKNSLGLFVEFAKAVKMIKEQFERFKRHFLDVNCKIKAVEKEYIMKLQESEMQIDNAQVRFAIPNPFKELHSWAKNEIADISAMLNTISICHSFENRKKKLERKLSLENKLVNKAQKGIDNIWKQMAHITKKYPEDPELKKARIKSEIEDITQILKIMTARLCEEELPVFKAERVKAYEDMMALYSELTLEGFTRISESAMRVHIEMLDN